MTLTSGSFQSDGTLTPDSMAATIERAMNELVAPIAGEDPMGRRRLALAIARGVVKHLVDNHDAFHTRVVNWSDPATMHDEPATIDADLGGWS
jgi:hypothetical protein